jgi:hypothetical protein
MTNWRRQLALATTAVLLTTQACFAADSIKWDAASDTVEATVETWSVPQMLQRVATATRWQIFIDPGITNCIPAKFSGKQPGDALRRLLGDYNYALVPETNAPSKLFVFRNSRDQATQAIRPIEQVAKKSNQSRIGNELVVTLKPGEKIEDVAKRLGAKIVGRSDDQNTYRLRFDDDKAADSARDDLADDSAVEGVDSNYYVSRPETAQPLGTPGGPLSLTPKVPPDGKYIVVGLIDTAVQPKEGNFSDFLLPGASVTEGPSSSGPSHGTTMAEAILRTLSNANEGKATTVRLLPMNVFGDNGQSTTTYDIAVGVYKAVNGGATIVNMSLGGDGDSKFLYNTIKSAHDQGVVFLAAAGNEPGTAPTYPAAYPESLAVTAGNGQGGVASWANSGNWVDIVAPGGGFGTFNGERYRVTGTSYSTAFATGMIAATAEKSNLRGAILEASVRQQTPR